MTRPYARRRRALAAGLVVPLLAVGLVGCGDDDAKSGGKAAATDSSTSSPSGSSSETPDTQPSGEEVDAADFADQLATTFDNLTTAKVSLSFDGTTEITSSGVVDYRGKTPAMEMTVEGAYGNGSTSKVILVDQVMYIQVAGDNAKYLEVDLSDPDSPLADSLGDMSSIDPRATLQAFTENLESVSKIGSEDIDGTATTHYVLVSDTDALASQLGKDADLPDSVSYDMWLDEEGRPRRIEAELGEKGSMRTDLTDYDTDVTIEAPPADQVQKMPGA